MWRSVRNAVIIDNCEWPCRATDVKDARGKKRAGRGLSPDSCTKQGLDLSDRDKQLLKRSVTDRKKNPKPGYTDVLAVRNIDCGVWLARGYTPAHQYCDLFYPLAGDLIGSGINQVMLWSPGQGQILGS